MNDFLSELQLVETEKTKEIRTLTQSLKNHKLYYSVKTIEDIRTYMKFQVWCVWDFMTLVKSIQAALIPNSVIWLPPSDASLGAYIYEILLTEETDINHTADGRASHFDTYLLAMEQAGADTSPILHFIDELRHGTSFHDAIEKADIPDQARRFVDTTIQLAHSRLHITVATFCLSREGIIPSMFTTFLNNMTELHELSIFKWYLNRHITIDNDSHGPLSVKLFRTVVGSDPVKLNEALDAAIKALEARKKFLDEILYAITSAKQPIII